jgi:hypothetical protein
MKKVVAMLIVAVCFAWGAPAKAEEGPYEKLGEMCGEQIETLCPGVAIGKGRILGCLEKNQDKLSKECNEARIAAKKQFEEQEPAD